MSDENSWPVTIRFELDDRSETFLDIKSLKQWVNDEQQFWGRIKGQAQQSQDINQNMARLNSITDAEELTAVVRLRAASKEYLTSKGPLGQILERIDDPNQAVVAFREVVRPGVSAYNFTSETARGIAFAAIYQAIGPELVALHDVRDLTRQVGDTLAEADRIRSGDASALNRFESLIDRCDEEWKHKLDGFEAKIALSAPKTYWAGRAESHSNLARNARRQWFWSLVFVSAAATIFLYFLLRSRPESNVAAEGIYAVQRILLVGTLLAFGVWWLRQKLRDVRSNEHLANDAAERVTMIEAYAAMRAAGLQDANLSPILTALYRAAMTGFADDTGPVLPLEIILKSIGENLNKK